MRGIEIGKSGNQVNLRADGWRRQQQQQQQRQPKISNRCPRKVVLQVVLPLLTMLLVPMRYAHEGKRCRR